MKAVYYKEFGDATVLELGERPVAEPGNREVLVKIAAAGVNPIDRRLRNGELTDYFQRTWPIIPGWDFSGEIVGLGKDVGDWKVGEKVAGLAFTWSLHHGTYAEYIPVSIDSIARLPGNMSFRQGAALPLVSLTAWQALHEFSGLRSGQSVLIQAGAGGVGSVAIAMAKHLGATIYTTTRAANFDYVKARGADHAIDYSTTDYFEFLKKAEPDGVDVVLETQIDDRSVKNAILLAKTGGAVPYMNNDPPAMADIAARNIKTEFLHHRADGAMLKDLFALYERGVLMMPEIESLPLEQAQTAHLRSESGRTRGKLVLDIQDMD